MSKVFKAVGNAISGVVKAVGNIVSGVVKAIGKVVTAVVNFVASPFMSLFGVPDAPGASQEAERQQGVLVQRQGSNVNLPLIYGYRRAAGIVVYAETGADNNKYLWVAYAMCEGVVEGLHQLFIDDNQLPSSIVGRLNAGETVDITEGRFKDRVRLQWYPGAYYQGSPQTTGIGANSILKDSPSWKATNYYNGVAVLFARYEWKAITTQEEADNNPFSGNIPTVYADILGKRVASLTIADPSQYTWDTAPIRYSTNPAECLLDYLRRPTYGKGLVNGDIDWDSFKTAAAKCNTSVTYITGVTGPILTLNYVVDTSQTIFNNVKTMLTNFRAYLPYVQGKYKLKIEDAGNPNDITSGAATVYGTTFDKDSIVGDITYTGIDRSSKYNQVVVTYVDPDNKWSNQQVVYPESEVDRQTYITQDGGREYKGEFTFGGITNYAIAKDMARLIWYKSRFQDTCSFKMDGHGFELEPGDNIYINSTVLQFGNDPNAGAIPWRIVSIKLNNDYTFDVGCVRNPDFMYPYTRVGEIDLVLPPYIPKGASIQFPRTVRVSLGLKPPTRATATDGYGGSGSHPAPTDPTGAGGGGNGGSGNATSPNTPPTPPPVIAPLTSVIRIDSATYTVENGQIYATLEFAQPDHAQYNGTMFYFKRNISTDTYWRTYDSGQKPGANRTVSIKIGPLLSAPYSLKSRVYYTTGESSTVVGTSTLNVVANTNENPVDFSETAVSGWTLPTTPPPNPRNTFWATVSALPLLTSGQPTNPRTMQVTLQQDIAVRGINGYVAGAKIYYKSSSATYWSESSYTFAQPYVEGVAQTFTLPFTLGVPTYPSAPGTADNYDFIFRAVYIDGTQSTYQYRIMNVNVEQSSLGSYVFNPFTERLPAAQGQELATAFDFTTVANAPPGSVIDPRDMTIGLLNIQERLPSGTQQMRVFINPPNAANLPTWYGVRIYKRPVSPGANPAFTHQDITPIVAGTGGEWSFAFNWTFDQEQELVIVPLVEYNGRVEAKSAWFGSGLIHNRTTAADYPSSLNWLSRFNMVLMDTQLALNKLNAVFPQADPTVQVTVWERQQLDLGNTLTANQWYYKLTYSHQHITSFQELHIYRRSRLAQAQPSGTSQFWGVGRWEKVTVTTTAPSGTVTVNLRPSIAYTEFATYNGNPSGTPGPLINTQFTTNKPVWPFSTGQSFDEFLLVVKAGGTVSAKAILLPSIQRQPLTSRVDGLNPNRPTTVTVADYNNYTASWLRNVSEARTPVDPANLITNGAAAGANPVPVVTPTIV